MTIHKTAIIYDGAQVHDSAEIGPYAVIGSNVKIGAGTTVGAHTIVEGHTSIGENCRLFPGASIGLDPQDLGYKNEPTGVQMGDRVTVREYVTIHRATKDGVTVIGDDCFLMNYCHVAHDCKIGPGVILANGATLAGHVSVGEYAVLAGVCVVHQHVRLGRLIMISGLSGTRVDMPPFTMCDGRPLKVRGINVIGMRRRKFAAPARAAIKEAYRLIYRTEFNLSQALERVEKEVEPLPEIAEILEFYRSSKRGVVGRAPQNDSDDD